MKKLLIVAVSLLLAGASAFAWSKKSENTGNLGRMYISISGAVDSSKADLKVPTNIAPVGGDMKSTPTGAYGQFMVNAPIFKPGINAFRNIKWAGVDGQIFFNYDYSGDYKASWTSGGAKTATISRSQYGIFAGLTPYLNFETGLPFLKAVKPFANGYAGYLWSDYDATIAGADFNRTGLQAVKLGIVAFIIPFMFVYDDALLLQGAFFHTMTVVVFAVIGIFALAFGLEGWMMGPISPVLRLLLVFAGILLIDPSWQTDLIGFVTLLGVFMYQKFGRRMRCEKPRD